MMTKELSNEKIIQTIIAKLMEQNAKYEAEIAKLDIQVHDLNEEMAKLEAKLNCDLPEYDPKISIVDRLRQLGQWTVDGTKSSPIYNRTADRIEQLEAALKHYSCDCTASYQCPPCMLQDGDCGYVARAALGGE